MRLDFDVYDDYRFLSRAIHFHFAQDFFHWKAPDYFAGLMYFLTKRAGLSSMIIFIYDYARRFYLHYYL